MKLIDGLGAFPRGVRWLLSHPRYLIIAFLPLVIGVVLFVIMGWWFLQNHASVVAWAVPLEAETWYGKTGIFLLARLFDIAFFVFSAVLSFLVANVVSSPLYDLISVAVERSVRGRAIEPTWKQSLAAVGEEIKKAVFILLVTGVVMVIPGLNILSVLLTAFLLGWDFYDYPLARRGISFRNRLRAVSAEGWAVVGFGIWLVIPFVQFLTMPLAVAGGTLLALESLPE